MTPDTPRRWLPPEYGRYRMAIALTRQLIAVAFIGVILRAGAVVTADSVLIGGALSALADLFGAPATIGIVSGIAVIVAAIRIHPSTNIGYATLLQSTPWNPGRTPPRGSVALHSPFVLLPACFIALLWLFNARASVPMTVGATIGYAVFGLLCVLIARRWWTGWVIIVLLIGLPPALDSRVVALSALLLAVLLGLAQFAERLAVRTAFLVGAFDVKRVQLQQRRSQHGWLSQMPLEANESSPINPILACIAGGELYAVGALMMHNFDEHGLRAFLIVIATIAGLLSTFVPWTYALPSYNIISRVMTARAFDPRMDRLLLTPAVFAVWLGFLWAVPWPSASWHNVVLAGVYATSTLLIAYVVTPSRLQWQICGASFIPTKASQAQRQAEANLKRLSESASVADRPMLR